MNVVPAWRSWLPRLGTLAALATTACCVGLPAAVSLVSAVGAGFLLTDRYLQPLLIVFLLVTVGSSAVTFWRHSNPAPLIVTVASGRLSTGSSTATIRCPSSGRARR